jgi:hypothetical protein
MAPLLVLPPHCADRDHQKSVTVLPENASTGCSLGLAPWKALFAVENGPGAVANETEEAGIEGNDTSDEADVASSVT